jgi:hypothetical protein
VLAAHQTGRSDELAPKAKPEVVDEKADNGQIVRLSARADLAIYRVDDPMALKRLADPMHYSTANWARAKDPEWLRGIELVDYVLAGRNILFRVPAGSYWFADIYRSKKAADFPGLVRSTPLAGLRVGTAAYRALIQKKEAVYPEVRLMILYPRDLSDDELAQLVRFPNLEVLYIGSGFGTKKPFRGAWLRQMKKLRYLGLCGVPAHEATLRDIASLRHLKSLLYYGNGSGQRYSEAFLVPFEGHPSLTDLDGGLMMTATRLKSLARIPNLRSVRIGCDFTKEEAEPLTRMKSLESLRCSSFSDDHISVVARIPNLKHLDLTHSFRLTGETLGELRRTASLRSLNLAFIGHTDDPFISEKGWQQIGQLMQIEELDVRATRCDDFALSQISRLSGLRRLWLMNEFSDAGVARLATLQKLQFLNMQRCSGMTDKAAEHLAKLADLRHLFPPLGFGSAACGHLVKLPRLETLDLSDTKIGDDDLRKIAKLETLRTLYLDGCDKITDDGIGHLASMPSLEVLSLRRVLVYKWPSRGPNTTFRCIPHLTKIKTLKMLDLSSQPIAVEHVASLLAESRLSLLCVDIQDKKLSRLLELTPRRREPCVLYTFNAASKIPGTNRIDDLQTVYRKGRELNLDIRVRFQGRVGNWSGLRILIDD